MNEQWNNTKRIIRTDVYRNLGIVNKKVIVKEFLKNSSPTGLIIHFRICNYYAQKSKKGIISKLLHSLCYMRFKKRQALCGVELNQRCSIGAGLRLPHRGAIVIHPKAVIGENCEIMQGVTIGNNILKSRDDVPIIGDNVLICAGAKIIGCVKVGNTVVIGANSVVTRDVEDNSVVAGSPAGFIKECGDEFVINRYQP